MEFKHIPVLLNETLDGLNIRDGLTYVDCTVGGAGHASELLKRNKTVKLVGIDQDIEAINASTKRLKEFEGRFTLVQDNFKNAPEILENLKIEKVDGVYADLGVSSHQIDSAERGFSFRFDAPLDMRMNKDSSLSAKEVVNNYSEQELKKVIKEFGEERFASNIARRICESRKKEEIKTTKQLEDIILSAVPRYRGNDGSSNVQRTFQAIRIEVNKELDGLKEFIEQMVEKLNVGGRLAIITFHSLEDRIVKHTFRELATGCTCPSDFPICVCGNKPKVKIITNHPIVAEEKELLINRRSSSAKLRVIEKL